MYIYNGDLLSGYNIAQLFIYLFCEFSGAYLGSSLALLLDSNNIQYIKIPQSEGLFNIIYTEFFFTGSFMFVILFVVSPVTTPCKNRVINIAVIVVWFYFIVNAGTALSGASYNPAIITTLNSIARHTKDPKALDKLHVFIISEICGAIFFSLIFKYLFEPYYKRVASKDKEIQKGENI
jgi:glycerol uptake facilitator-like aquaporin